MDREEDDVVDAEPVYIDPSVGQGGGALILSTPDAQQYRPFAGAAEGAVTEDQATVLAKFFDDAEHDIKPTGEVFVPQVHYRRRLNMVFKPGGWGLIPYSEVKSKAGDYGKITFFQNYHLLGAGRFLAAAWGEQEYQPKNANTTEATALEGVKSNALVRCCKDLGLGSECWDKTWCDQWKAKFAVEVWTENISSNPKMKGKKKKFWRLKSRDKFTFPWKE